MAVKLNFVGLTFNKFQGGAGGQEVIVHFDIESDFGRSQYSCTEWFLPGVSLNVIVDRAREKQILRFAQELTEAAKNPIFAPITS